MQVHEIKKPKSRSAKRIGRGGKRGTYSGRGMKGQKSRAGAGIRPEIRDYIMRTPKLKGPTTKAEKAVYPTGLKNQPVFTLSLGKLEKAVKKDDVVTIEFLSKKKLVPNYKGKLPKYVKILATGELKKSITVKGLLLSKSAKKQIEEAGGKVEA